MKLFNIFKKFHFNANVNATRVALLELPEFRKVALTASAGGFPMVGNVQALHFSNALRSVDETVLKSVLKKTTLPEAFLQRVKLESANLPDAKLFELGNKLNHTTQTLTKGDSAFTKLAQQTSRSLDKVALESNETMNRLAKTLKRNGVSEVVTVRSNKRLRLLAVAGTVISTTLLIGFVTKHMEDTSGCLLSHLDPTTGRIITYKLVHLSRDKSTDVYAACPPEILAKLPDSMRPDSTVTKPVNFPKDQCCFPKQCPSSSFLSSDNETLQQYKCWCSETTFGEALSDVLGNIPQVLAGAVNDVTNTTGTLLRWLPRLMIAAVVIIAIAVALSIYRRLSPASASDGGGMNAYPTRLATGNRTIRDDQQLLMSV